MNEVEIAQLRSYLASQAMRRTPAQLLEALQKTYAEFVQATHTIPDSAFYTSPQEQEWSAAKVVAHVQTMLAAYQQAISMVLECGEQPEAQSEAISGAIDPSLQGVSREQLLSALEATCEHLRDVVLRADPQAHLDLSWGHFELGQMHWREWLLFARVHLKVHVQQMQDLARQMEMQS
ncbi:DinB family protein [Ktedonosporobacter rubrisoli]|nr:DinB family protein [Ktedonosporobacter rubrisoli]